LHTKVHSSGGILPVHLMWPSRILFHCCSHILFTDIAPT